MNTVPHRVVLYAKDVSNITGLRRRTSRKLLAAIRQKLGKEPSAFVTVQDFSAFTGIGEDILLPFLK